MVVPQQLSMWIACSDPAADPDLSLSFRKTLRSSQKLFIHYRIYGKKIWWLWLCDGVFLVAVRM